MDPVMASTPRTKEPGHQEEPSAISRISTAGGDVSSALQGSEKRNSASRMEHPLPQPSALSLTVQTKRSKLKTSSLRRMKESLSNTQSRIVELFSGGKSQSSMSLFKLHQNNKAESRNDQSLELTRTSAGVPAAMPSPIPVARKKTPTPSQPQSTKKASTFPVALKEEKGVAPSNSKQQVGNVENSMSKSEVAKSWGWQKPELQDSKKHKKPEGGESRPAGEKAPSQKQLESFLNKTQEYGWKPNWMLAQMERDEQLDTENRKLRKENRQLWQDNRELADTLKNVMNQLEGLQTANYQQEVTFQMEAKIMADFISDCHREIIRLRGTQCELLRMESDKNEVADQWGPNSNKRKIQEHYIAKYS